MWRTQTKSILIALVLILPTALSLIHTTPAYAGFADPIYAAAKTTQASIKNAFRVNIGSYTFLDESIAANPLNNNNTTVNFSSDDYIIQNAPAIADSCDFITNLDFQNNTYTLNYVSSSVCGPNGDNSGTNFDTQTFKIDPSTDQYKAAYFTISGNGGYISTGNGRRVYNLQSGSSTSFVESDKDIELQGASTSGPNCQDVINLNSNDINSTNGQLADQAGNASLVIRSNQAGNYDSSSYPQDAQNATFSGKIDGSGCYVSNPISIWIANTAPPNGPSKGVAPTQAPGSSLGQSGTSATSSSPTCDSSGGPLSWIFCSAVTEIANAEQSIESVIDKLLKTKPIDFSSSDPTHLYNIWSNFRVFGDIVLVIGVLIVVFVETLGGGGIEAYSAKRMLPRILIAAILINLSIYIVAGAFDITNILGQGINGIISAPFQAAHEWKISVNGFAGNLGFAGLVGAGAALWAGGSEAIAAIALFVGMPVLLAIIGVLATLMIREGLIIFLLFISPVAFALYTLPNTEQYFRKWWDLLFKTLLIYPIVSIVFAMSNVVGVVMSSLGISPAWLGELMGVAARVAPLFLIPFAFKLAGGLLGQLHEGLASIRSRAAEGIKGNVNDQFSRRNMTKRALNDKVYRGRERAVSRGINMQKTGGVVRRRLGGALAGISGGANFELGRARMNREAMDIMNTQSQTGGDNLIRGVFAKRLSYKDSNGKIQQGWFGTGARVGKDGLVVGQKSANFSDYEVGRARAFYGRSASMYQSALNYEMGKVGDDEEYGELLNRNVENFNQWAIPLRPDAGAIQLGAGFAQQSARKEGKHLKLKRAGRGESGVDANGQAYNEGDMYYDIDHSNFARDVAENVGNYPLANMKESTPSQLRASYDWANRVIDAPDDTVVEGQRVDSNLKEMAKRTKKDIRLVAQSSDTRYGGGQSLVPGEEGEAPVPGGIPRGVTLGALEQASRQGGAPITRITTGAPGRVDDQINAFVDHVLGPVGGDGRRTGPAVESSANRSTIEQRRAVGGGGPDRPFTPRT